MTNRPLPHVDGIEHHYVDAGGVRIHVAEAGSGEPLLLLHGWPQHWYEWRQVMPELARDFRVLAPDLRGFGWSAAPGSGYDPLTFASDQIALLDALGIEKTRVIGHDWGGFTTFMLGIAYPDRIERLIACNTPHPWGRPSVGLALELWRIWYVLANATPGLGTRLHEHGITTKAILTHGNVGDPFSDEEVAIYVDSFREPERAAAGVALYRWYLGTLRTAAQGKTKPASSAGPVGAAGWLKQRLTVPALLLFGERDLYVSTRYVSGYEPHADQMSHELVPDSGHFLVNEKPDLVVDRARSFFGVAQTSAA